jgi:flavin reductase (DIM6/NTAB) family NADH-FMN oxidoreductase RutF
VLAATFGSRFFLQKNSKTQKNIQENSRCVVNPIDGEKHHRK